MKAGRKPKKDSGLSTGSPSPILSSREIRKFETLRQMYYHTLSLYANRPSFSMHGGESLTYMDFSERVDELIGIFLSAGLRSGDKMALYSSNMPNWPVAYFATVISGMVVVPILPDFSGPEVDKLIEHSESKALVVSDKLYTKISKDIVSKLNVVIRSKNLGVISQTCEERGEFAEPGNGDLAAIIYTSGTTSSPKGVMLSHDNLCSQLQQVSILQEIRKEDIFLSILPLSHTFECSLGMLLPFMWGSSVVYLDKLPSASVLLPALKAVRPTIMLSVPLIIEKIFKNKILPQVAGNWFKSAIYKTGPGRRFLHRIAGKRLMETFGGRIRFFGIGGAKLESRVDRFLFEAEFPYAIGYGLTETSPVLAGANPEMVRYQSTGPLLYMVEGRLDNVNPISGEGEIVVKGPNVMMGYYKNPEATADSYTDDGWFRTKDLGTFDEDGFLYIKGRLTNMILGPSGENIYPEEIEDVINGHALVNDSLVTEDMGKLVAIVHFDREAMERKYHEVKEELGNRMEAIKNDLMNYVNSKVNRFSRISVVVENEEGFEKTPTNKIKRFMYNRQKQNENGNK